MAGGFANVSLRHDCARVGFYKRNVGSTDAAVGIHIFTKVCSRHRFDLAHRY